MPIYGYACQCGEEFDRYLRYESYDNPQFCRCGRQAVRQIFAPIMVSVSPNICYDSPITGKPITSLREREEDLARNNCRPYDPGMKQDYEQRLKREDEALDRSVDEVVEKEVALMPARKREHLFNELASGVDAEVVRRAV